MVEGGALPCFDCLRRRLQSDVSPDLVFCYGVSDSALPFGSTAVVEIYLTGGADNIGSEEVSAQFVVVEVNCENSDLSSLENGVKGDVDSIENVSLSCKGEYETEVEASVLTEETSPSLENNDVCLSNCGLDGPVAVDHQNPTISSCERFSWLRMIAALVPVPFVGQGSDAAIKDLVCKYLSGSIENHVISSLILFAEGKLAGKYGSSLLSLVGFPSFSESNVANGVRHPNISPILGIIRTAGYDYLLHPKVPYTLENILHYSPDALKSDWRIRFFIYQIFSALAYIHGSGVAHGNICPASILLTDSCWSWVSIGDMRLLRDGLTSKVTASSSSKIHCCMDHCLCQAIYADLNLSNSIDWHSDFKRWWRGELSNYEYLLVLNRLAGRRWGDRTFHTVMPWVIDFSVKPDENSDTGWRDLKKSKWRLAKGDEQLDFTYQSSEIPHHVSDECLSELAVCSYKARRLPLRILRSAVRSVYEPNEYPSNMQRLYQWTPDECIPEFYSDPEIFISIHSEMSDLAVPSWATSPEEFISLHRQALESDRVSKQLHHWIDITFGYKLSGEPSIAAKNVMLPISDPAMPRATGRRQLFNRPHPMRQSGKHRSHYNSKKEVHFSCRVQGSESNIDSGAGADTGSTLQLSSKQYSLPDTSYMEDLEEATSFCEHARYLSPIYDYHETVVEELPSFTFPQNDYHKMETTEPLDDAFSMPSGLDLNSLIECLEVDDSGYVGFQELLHWRHKSSSLGICSEEIARDIFSVGCIISELYMKQPLFDPVSLVAYRESGTLPGIVQELPPHAAVLVEACIQKDWKRRPSAKWFLESQYFPPTVRSAYLFLAPLHLVAETGYRLQYAAKLASQGALKAMGTYAAEMCAPYCLPLITSSLSDVEAESAFCLIKEFLKCLSSQAIKTLIIPTIQKILQASEYSHLKVSLLQDSFLRDLWTRLGKQVYLEKIHPLVISNLYNSGNKTCASVAAVVLIGSSEELGIPITVNQTILPLIHSFGKGLCADAIDALVRIGGLLGEAFIIKQVLPLLRNVILSCIDASRMNKPEPVNSLINLALIDSFSALDGLVLGLPVEMVLKELVQDQICLHVTVLLQTHMDLPVIQVAATSLIAVCQRIGPDFTASYVMPQLKDLFNELVFSQEANSEPVSGGRYIKASGAKPDDFQIESRMDLVLLLYPSLASLIGIEKIRQCCSAWFLLEQILLRFHNWKADMLTKWESKEESSQSVGKNMNAQRLYFGKISSSDYNPAKMLLNGVGWSIPQSQGVKGGLTMMKSKQLNEVQQNSSIKYSKTSNLEHHEPWFWFPSADMNCDRPDFLGRNGGLKDELPWKIKASILYSARAHPGALRSLAVCHDECTIYTGGVGPGFKGSIQKWELPRMNCISGYYGHDEVVNSICILSISGRIASCDGSIHVWNGQTGKLISAYAESSANFPQRGLPFSSKGTGDQANMLMPNGLSGGVLSNAFSGSLYTSMHHLESDDKLLAGMGSGSIRFIDILQDRKLHLWKSDAAEYSFSSLVSAICSCGSEKFQGERARTSPSWIAAGLSSGHCRLFDARSGNIVAFWRAHDGYITKLAAPEDHLLVSSSFDKTLRVWDLRRDLGPQSNVFRGHQDGISSFCVWGQDVISVSRNKIALTSLSRSTDEGGQQRLSPQKLYSVDRGMTNLSALSTISVLPFSRLFLVGTEDGYLKICC